MNSEDYEIATVPMACYEAEQHRYHRIIRMIAICWATSILALAGAAAYILLH